jgi:RNA polymerase sigma-70 factor, ECF subfamily
MPGRSLEPEEAEEVYTEHKDRIWRVAQRMLKGQSINGVGVSAEDIVMTVMLEVLAKGVPDSLGVRDPGMGAYLSRLTIRRSIDALRKGNREVPFDPMLAQRADPTATDPLTAAENDSLLQRCDELLARLTPNERHVLVERVRKGRPAKDVAQELGVTPPRVSQLVAAALTKLRKGLGEDRDASQRSGS